MKRILTFTFILALLIVGYIKNNINTVYADDEPDYLCFKFEGVGQWNEGETGSLSLIFCGGNIEPSLSNHPLQYSKDKQNWDSIDIGTGFWSIEDLTEGDCVYFKRAGEGTYSFSSGDAATSTASYFNFNSDDKFEVSGDVTTLINGSGNVLNLTQCDEGTLDYCFYGLFLYQSYKFVDLVLPSTTLTPHCYESMFNGCLCIETAPDLPATTLAEGCYGYMFYGCEELKTAPTELNATSLKPNCYEGMFMSCPKLINAPEILATTTAVSCCTSMFNGCTELETAPSNLYATELKDHCYQSMFNGCSKLETTPIMVVESVEASCCDNMFTDCSKITNTQIELHSTSLAEFCYRLMFSDCEKLEVAPELPATTLAIYCYEGMFLGCTNLKIAPELPSENLAESCYNTMFQNCSNLMLAPELPATNLAKSCYFQMFYNCSNLKIPPLLPATELQEDCYNSMFGSAGINISDVFDGEYNVEYKLPSEGVIASSFDNSTQNMFFNCPGPTSNSMTYGTPDVSNGSATLYLKRVTLTISFDGNCDNVSNVPIDQSKQPFGEITLPTASSISRSGYTLKGWSLRPDGKDNFYLPGASVNARGDMKFYAIWEEISNPSSPSSGDSTNTSTRHIVPNTSVIK